MMNTKSLKRAFRKFRKSDPFHEGALSLRHFAHYMKAMHVEGEIFCPAAGYWLKRKGCRK